MMNKDYPSYLPNGQPETGMYVVAKKKATQEEIDAHQAMKAKRSEDSVPIEQWHVFFFDAVFLLQSRLRPTVLIPIVSPAIFY